MARSNSDIKTWHYHHYVADCLKLISEGRAPGITLKEYLTPVKVDNRTAEDITNEVMRGAGLKWKE